MSSKVVHLRPYWFKPDDLPKALGVTAVVQHEGFEFDAIVCTRAGGPNYFMCAFAESYPEQLALAARLERKRFKKATRQTPPAA